MNKIQSMSLLEKIIFVMIASYALFHALGVVIMILGGDFRSGSIIWLLILIIIIFRFVR